MEQVLLTVQLQQWSQLGWTVNATCKFAHRQPAAAAVGTTMSRDLYAAAGYSQNQQAGAVIALTAGFAAKSTAAAIPHPVTVHVSTRNPSWDLHPSGATPGGL